MPPKQTVNSQEVVNALRKASSRVKAKQDQIRELDAACGDGDLGITVKRGFTAIEQLLADIEDGSLDGILRQIGMEFNNAAASTFGALFATALVSASKEVKNKTQINVDDLFSMLKAACTGVQSRGGAELGDKTLLDALIPATESVGEVASSNSATIEKALEEAVIAAQRGLESTKGMKPQVGRAKQLGGKVNDVQDPGATVVYIFLVGLSYYDCQS